MTTASKPGGKRVTIIGIARKAGVSPKTVSRVMNGEPHVKQAVRDQIKAIAQEMNHRPNVMAQGLIARRAADGLLALPDGAGSVAPVMHEHQLCLRNCTAGSRLR